jgi:hypothetical protein
VKSEEAQEFPVSPFTLHASRFTQFRPAPFRASPLAATFPPRCPPEFP